MLLIEWECFIWLPHPSQLWALDVTHWAARKVSHFDTVTLFYIYMCSSQEGGKGMVTMKQVRKTGGARKRSKVKKKLLSKIWGMEGDWESENLRKQGGVSGSERPTIHYLLNRKECDAFVSRLQSAIFHLKVWIWHRAAQISNLLAACTVSRSSSHLLNLLCCFSVICI